jgi:Uma2 family endonuclease
MNVHARNPTTPDEFVRWNENREGKREFVRGTVVEMIINTTIRHAVIASRLTAILLRQFPYPEFFVGSADVAVRTHAGVRYPDVFVDRGSPEHGDLGLVAEHPVLLAEVLSSSSVGRDFLEKAAEYTAIPSLRFYLVASQDEPRVWLWARDAQDTWQEPQEIEGTEPVVSLSDLDATLPLAELYAGIEPRR